MSMYKVAVGKMWLVTMVSTSNEWLKVEISLSYKILFVVFVSSKIERNLWSEFMSKIFAAEMLNIQAQAVSLADISTILLTKKLHFNHL
jgi:hypothetical protein